MNNPAAVPNPSPLQTDTRPTAAAEFPSDALREYLATTISLNTVGPAVSPADVATTKADATAKNRPVTEELLHGHGAFA